MCESILLNVRMEFQKTLRGDAKVLANHIMLW